MTAKVGAESAVERRTAEMSGTTMTPASLAGTQKVSMFAAKAGFVIPSNKLSGSLVPVFREVKIYEPVMQLVEKVRNRIRGKQNEALISPKMLLSKREEL